MSTKHTPGPWGAFSDDGHTNIVAFKPRTTVVFSLPGRDKREPDVQLVVAAPDLLEAAQWYMRVCPADPDTTPAFQAATNALTAAIAKATEATHG